jgi:DNA-binding response OmpR family regulator
MQLSDTVKQFLEHQGYEVIVAYDAHEAQDKLYEHSVDLMLLDVKVPYQSGFDLLSNLREQGDQTPAIFITSLHTVEDLTKGFDAGCDDYIRKPFSLKELQLRIDANIKKNFSTHDDTVKIDNDKYFNIKQCRLIIDNTPITLKNKEAKLLEHFLKHPHEILGYEDIFAVLWDYDEEPNNASLRTYIHTLRTHLGKDMIETIKNTGYRFAAK